MFKVGDRIVVDLGDKKTLHANYLKEYSDRLGKIQSINRAVIGIEFDTDPVWWYCYIEDIKLDTQYYREEKLEQLLNE